MNLKEIREMIRLMNENELSEIEVEREGSKLKLKKSAAELADIVMRQQPIAPLPAAPVAAPTPTPSAPVAAGDSSSGDKNEIKSPMVGTFYRSPSPEAPPYVEAGQIVEVGQVICIIEAMKLMNEIKSEVRGKIVEIPIENAQPVEFGQALFVIEPA